MSVRRSKDGSRRKGAVALLAVPVAIAALAGPAAAQAAEQISVTFPYTFNPETPEMDQGEYLSFKNTDPNPNPVDNQHDVTATKNGPDGQPLFKSATVPPGTEVFVEGSQYLTSGTYDFLCSKHPLGMKGTLTVTTAGTPVPRPGSNKPAPSPGGLRDTTPPNLGLDIVKSRVKRILDKGKVTVETSVTEPVVVSLKVEATVGKRKITLGKRTLDVPTARKRAVAVRITSSGRDRLKRAMRDAKSARIQVSGKAKDPFGNADRDTAGMKFLR